MTTQTVARPAVETVLVVLGLDADAKPHAAKFKAVDQVAVIKAAASTGQRIVRVTGAEIAKLTSGLPDGKIYASGKGFVPLVKRDIYEQLAKLLGTNAEILAQPAVAPQAASTSSSPKTADDQSLPQAWRDLRVGSMVLARDAENEGWYEAIVVAVAPDDANVLRLRFRDFPEEGQFNLHRGRVAILTDGVR